MKGGRQHAVTMAICAHTNPFCKESLGSKIPDESAAFTVPFQSHFFTGIMSDVNGAAAFYASPDISFTTGNATTITASVATAWSYTVSPDSVALYNYRDYRVVSWGARWLTTAPWTTAQGIAIGSTISTKPDTVLNAINVGALTNGQDVQTYAVRDLNCTFIGKPQDHVWTEFTQTASATEGFDAAATPWTQFLLTLQGTTASTLIGSVEVVINFELRTAAGNVSSLQQLGSNAAKPNHPLQQLVAETRHNIPSTIATTPGPTGIDKYVYNLAAEAVKHAPQLLEMAFMLL
jgi:hypothetical protein